MAQLIPSPQSEPHKIALMGGPGTGKTRVACAAMRGAPEVFGTKGIYLGIDPGSLRLGSVLPQDKSNLYVWEVFPKNEPYDPYIALANTITKNWKEIHPDAGTIIVDTMSTWADDTLQFLANSGRFSEKHVVLSPAAGNVDRINQPMPGDYMGTQALTMNILRILKDCPLNVIVLFHEAVVEPEPGQPGQTIGGPATAGKAAVRKVGGFFDTLMRTEVRTVIVPGKPQVTEFAIRSAPHGIWSSKLRTGHPTNPLANVVIQDPADMWREFAKVTA